MHNFPPSLAFCGLRHAEAELLRGERRLRKPTGGLRHAVGPLRRTEDGSERIRTSDGVSPMPHFECGAFDHSATLPNAGAL